LETAKKNPERFFIVDITDKTIDEVHECVITKIKELLKA